jgi:hypothetical protein
MVERSLGRDQVNWRLPFYAVVGAAIVMLSLFAYSADPTLLYIFFIAPIVCLSCLVLLLVATIRKRPRRSLSMLLALVAFLVTSGALLKAQDVLRPSLRWLLWSHRFKAEVLAQPTPANGELKHLEWDGWGGAPVGDWAAYVVFDPTDSLSVAAKNGWSGSYNRYKGIPCDVGPVRRLESHWYSVVLGVNEWWGRCG